MSSPKGKLRQWPAGTAWSPSAGLSAPELISWPDLPGRPEVKSSRRRPDRLDASARRIAGVPSDRESTVVVSGASGFVGRAVCGRGEVRAIRGRWHDREDLDRLLGPMPIERAIHLAWNTAPGYAYDVQANAESLASSLEFVDAVVARGARHIVVAGTAAEYAPADRPRAEGDPVGPLSPYGAAKAHLHDELQQRGEIDVAWARIFSLTGSGERPSRLIPLVSAALLRGESVPLTDGEQVRDYLEVEEVAAALTALSFVEARGIFNVCSAEGISIRELLTALATALDADPALLDFGARVRDSREPQYLVGRNERLRATVPWTPGPTGVDLMESVAQRVRVPRP
jgi:nucleoside-diphosphate-sugar epimerase